MNGDEDEVLTDTVPPVAIGDHFGRAGSIARYEVTARVAPGIFFLIPEGQWGAVQVTQAELLSPHGKWFRWVRRSVPPQRHDAASVHEAYASNDAANAGADWMYREVLALRSERAEPKAKILDALRWSERCGLGDVVLIREGSNQITVSRIIGLLCSDDASTAELLGDVVGSAVEVLAARRV